MVKQTRNRWLLEVLLSFSPWIFWTCLPHLHRKNKFPGKAVPLQSWSEKWFSLPDLIMSLCLTVLSVVFPGETSSEIIFPSYSHVSAPFLFYHLSFSLLYSLYSLYSSWHSLIPLRVYIFLSWLGHFLYPVVTKITNICSVKLLKWTQAYKIFFNKYRLTLYSKV